MLGDYGSVELYFGADNFLTLSRRQRDTDFELNRFHATDLGGTAFEVSQ